MKRTLALALLLAAAASAAETDLGEVLYSTPGLSYLPPVPPGRDMLQEQPYSFPPVDGLGSSSAYNYKVCDDLHPEEAWTITNVRLWGIYLDGHPQPFKVQLYPDNGAGIPVGNDVLQTVTVHVDDVTDTDTGDSCWGYHIYRIDLDLPSTISLDADTVYWLAIQAQSSSNFYWMANTAIYWNMCYFSASNGSKWTSSYAQWGTAYHTMLAIYGEVSTPVQAISWGQIKALVE